MVCQGPNIYLSITDLSIVQSSCQNNSKITSQVILDLLLEWHLTTLCQPRFEAVMQDLLDMHYFLAKVVKNK